MTITTIAPVNMATAINSIVDSKSHSEKNLTIINDNFAESDETTQFKNIVKDSDVSNMSRNEANDMFRELYEKGFMDLKDMMIMTFDPTHIAEWEDGVSSINGWNVSSNPNQKMNYLDGFKTQLDFAQKYGNRQSQEALQKAIEMFEKINYFQG